jgi:ribosomal protein S17E
METTPQKDEITLKELLRKYFGDFQVSFDDPKRLVGTSITKSKKIFSRTLHRCERMA